MPSFHKILKLQACGRGSSSSCGRNTRSRLTPTKSENGKLVASSDHLLAARAFAVISFAAPLSSSQCPSRVLDTTNSIINSETLASPSSIRTDFLNSTEFVHTSRSTASRQRYFYHQLSAASCEERERQFSINCVPIQSRERLGQVTSKDGGNFSHRVSGFPFEGSRGVTSALRNGAWTERRWPAFRLEEKALERVSTVGLSRLCSEDFGGKAERGGGLLERKTVPDMVWELSKPPRVVDNSRAGGSSLLQLAAPGAAESLRSLQSCVLSYFRLDGPRVGVSMGALCTIPVVRNVTTAERGALRKQDLAGQGRVTAVNSTLLSRFFDHKHGIRSPVKVAPLRAAHDVSLASDGVATRSDHQSSETARAGQTLRFLSGVCNLPHPEKEKTGGEDAFFICSDKHVFGVADGVGGWSDLGIDAGQYARDLMSHAAGVVRDDSTGCMDPVDVMEKAHSLTRCQGSATACILALTDSSLEAANLGDSGFLVVRNNRTVFKSPSQQHQFNIPFQLEHGGSDPPRTAQVFSVPVREGDVVITATDGLFDNVYDTELITHVVQAGRGHLTPQVTAERIAKLARSHAKDKNRQTPFATAAQDAGFRIFGGKMDDITVIVTYIIRVK